MNEVRRTEVLIVRLTKNQKDVLKKVANQEEKLISEVVREALASYANKANGKQE